MQSWAVRSSATAIELGLFLAETPNTKERHIVFEAVLKRPQKSQGGKGVCGHRAVRNPEVVGGGCGERSISSRLDDDLLANSRPVHDHQQGWLVLPFAFEQAQDLSSPGMTESLPSRGHADRLETLRS